jgi:hypothetical protein
MSRIRKPTAEEQDAITDIAHACIRLQRRKLRNIGGDIRAIAERVIALAHALESRPARPRRRS